MTNKVSAPVDSNTRPGVTRSTSHAAGRAWSPRADGSVVGELNA